MTLIYHHLYLKIEVNIMVNENIIYLEDIKTYSRELLEYVKYGFITNDEILKEIIIYFECATEEIDNIKKYILELESKISELERD